MVVLEGVPMTDGEKMVWAAAFALELKKAADGRDRFTGILDYEEYRRAWAGWEAHTALAASKAATHAVLALRGAEVDEECPSYDHHREMLRKPRAVASFPRGTL